MLKRCKHGDHAPRQGLPAGKCGDASAATTPSLPHRRGPADGLVKRLLGAFLLWLAAGLIALLISVAPWGARGGLPLTLWVLLSWPLALWALLPLLWRHWIRATVTPASPRQALGAAGSRLLFGAPAWLAWTVLGGVVDVIAGPSASWALDMWWLLASLALALWIASPLLRMLGRRSGGQCPPIP